MRSMVRRDEVDVQCDLGLSDEWHGDDADAAYLELAGDGSGRCGQKLPIRKREHHLIIGDEHEGGIACRGCRALRYEPQGEVGFSCSRWAA